ncbi:hypothetical protein QQF64_007027 [Cirrhinus molitorella]|uniref:Uncharacterized protein n=1 Tax=Cirrhinus molitorella TaxID=172907 RepID=A0ABR3MCW3_9TELE
MIPLYGNVKVDTQESIVDPEHQQAVCGSIAVSVAPLMNVTDDLMPGVIQLELDWQEKSLSSSYLAHVKHFKQVY